MAIRQPGTFGLAAAALILTAWVWIGSSGGFFSGDSGMKFAQKLDAWRRLLDFLD